MARNRDDQEGMQLPLNVLVRFASKGIGYDALFHDLFEECIHIILSLKQLEMYHSAVEKLWENYQMAMETGDQGTDMEFLIQDTGIQF